MRSYKLKLINIKNNFLLKKNNKNQINLSMEDKLKVKRNSPNHLKYLKTLVKICKFDFSYYILIFL